MTIVTRKTIDAVSKGVLYSGVESIPLEEIVDEVLMSQPFIGALLIGPLMPSKEPPVQGMVRGIVLTLMLLKRQEQEDELAKSHA